MTAGPILLAANPFLSTEFLIAVGLLVAALLVGAVVVYVTDQWRKRQMSADRESAGSLGDYREMYENGEITLGEYERLRAKVATQMKGTAAPVDLASDAGSHAAPPPAGPTPPPEAGPP